MSRLPGGLTTFFKNVLQHNLVERQIGHQALQLRVLLLQLRQLPGLAGFKPPIDLLPAIEGLFRDADLADQVRHRRTNFRFLQYRNDLLH